MFVKELADFISDKIKIQETDKNIILSKFKYKTLEKGEFLVKKGQIARHYFYIKSGGLRFYFGDFEEEITAWVIFADEFFTEISSLNPQLPTRFNIEAIEKTEVFYISRSDMELMYKQFPVWQEFGRLVWEKMAMRMIDQILRFQTLSAEQRYLEFIKIPGFLQRVPIKQLASYLGITPNALSRIRKNIK